MNYVTSTNNEVNKFFEPVKYSEVKHIYPKRLDSTHLKALCVKYVPFWDDLRDEDIEINTIKLYKNKVYSASLIKPNYKSKRLNKVLMRLISDEKHVLFDSEFQSDVALVVGHFRFGPKVISVFKGGRIEEWLEGFVLHSNSLFNLSVLTSVATLLAKFHKTITAIAPKEWDRTPSLLNKIEEWLPLCKKINREHALNLDVEMMQAYFDEYKRYLSEYLEALDMPEYPDFQSNGPEESERSRLSDEEVKRLGSNYGNRVLFCHNDLHLKNLIATYDGLTLIDFEYSSFNFVGADIGYFFVESNFDYDCTEYPFFKLDRSLELSYDLKVMFASVYLSESLGANVLPDRTDIIDPFLKSIELYSLGTLLFWAFWGIVMLSLNETNSKFNYKEYSIKKLELYDEKFAEFKAMK